MPYFTTSDGLNLHYLDQGTGQPILCLAGLTRNARDFEFVLPHLSNARVVRMDYRGRGGSDYDPNYANYSILREAQDAIELLDHLGLQQVTLLGTSRGGLIAMTLAALHRDRLAGVILNDIGPDLPADALARIMEYVGVAPAAKTLEQAAQGLARYYVDEFPGVDHARWLEQADAQFAQGPDGLTLRYDPKLRDALIEAAQGAEMPDLWPFFDALAGLPTGLIRGENSDLLTQDTMQAMINRRPDLVAINVPDRGHVPFLDEPEALSVIHKILGQTA